MTKQLVVNADYNGLAITFTGDGWFNATQAAKRFGKRPNDSVNFIRTKRGGNTVTSQNGNAQGTWLHPTLAVRFAQWLATCSTSPSYAKVDLESNMEISLIKRDVRKYQSIASHYQPLDSNSFILVDTVAVTGNNDYQELQNLSVSVQHHTIVDVFLCLSFANLPVMGELRLAIAFIALWWGGHGNKPLGANTVCRVTAVLNLPAALHLGLINKTTIPFRKVQ